MICQRLRPLILLLPLVAVVAVVVEAIIAEKLHGARMGRPAENSG